MKKILLGLFFALVCSGLNAQIPNSGFEDWVDQFFYDDPVDYGTSNIISFILSGAPNVTKVDRPNGGNAVRLETNIGLAGPMAGLINNGKFDSGINGGQPWTSQPDSMTLQMRYKILPGDTANIIVLFKKDSKFVAFNIFEIEGEVSDWTSFNFPLSPYVAQPDTMLFVVQSSTNLSGIGSFLELDSIQFENSTDQLSNANLEDWRSVNFYDPELWTSLNFPNAIYGDSVSVSQTDDAFEGDFAARIESVYSYAQGDTAGILSSNDQLNGIEGFPIAEKPAALRGYYKYEPATPNDLAFVAVQFGFFDIAVNQRRDTFVFMPLLPTPDYKEFNLDILGLDIPQPDTAIIIFSSTNFVNPVAGSVLIVDKLDFIPTTSIEKEVDVETIRISPNPAVNYISFNKLSDSYNGKRYIIYDNSGKVVLSGIVNDVNYGIDISGIPSGTYNITVENEVITRGSFVKIPE